MLAKNALFFILLDLLLLMVDGSKTNDDQSLRSWSNSEGLQFVVEPGPSQAIFSNLKGLVLHCSAISRSIDKKLSTNNKTPINSQTNKHDHLNQQKQLFSSLENENQLVSSSSVNIKWLRKSNQILNLPSYALVHNMSNLIYIRPSDQALVFNAFTPEQFRLEIHLSSYYCAASNHLGTILSHEVQVQAVITNNIQVNVYDEYVTRGQSVAFECHITANFKELLQISAWILNDGRRLDPIKLNTQSSKLFDSSKPRMFAVLDQLVLTSVTQEDVFRSFKCEVRNLITNEVFVSSTSGKLIITEPTNNIPPTIQINRSNLKINGQAGKQAILTCMASGNPMPNYRWFYSSNVAHKLSTLGVYHLNNQILDFNPNSNDHLIELNMASNWKYQLISETGFLFIRNLTESDSGSYICVANNSYGQDQKELRLTVKQKLLIQLNSQPNIKEIELLDSIQLKCNILIGYPIQTVSWFHNAILLNHTQNEDLVSSSNLQITMNSKHKFSENGLKLTLTKFEHFDQGCYQCMVKGGFATTILNSFSKSKISFKHDQSDYRLAKLDDYELNHNFYLNFFDTMQDSICFQLSEKPPKLKKHFNKSILKQGEKLSLRCVASGNPLPTVTWTIFENNLPENHRIQYGDYVSLAGDVVSYVNISSVNTADSGLYTCTAINSAGIIKHSEFIHVNGPLSIRTMHNRTALSGQKIYLHCPVLGYPFQFIRWSKLLKSDHTTSSNSLSNLDSNLQILEENTLQDYSNIENERHLVQMKSSERIRVFDNGTLIISQVNRELDSGWYRCEVGDLNGIVREKMLLNVISKPTVSQFQFPAHLTQGMRIIITCNVLTGDPPIRIDWLHNNRTINFKQLNGKLINDNNLERSDISEVGSSLVFRQVNTTHRGSYTCKAINEAGQDQYTAIMTVKSAPRWLIEPQDQSAIVGEIVTFQCQSEGFPTPLIHWKTAKENRGEFKSISSNYHIQTLENGSLTIKELKKSDAGYYMCESGNSVGLDLVKVVQLNVFTRAHFKLNFDLFRVQHKNSLRISCTAYGDKPLNIRWLKERIELNPLIEKRYIITEKETSDGLVSELYASVANREDSGTFTCLASNAYGQGEQHNRVLVEETPDPPANIEIAEYTHRSITLRYVQPYTGNLPITKYICQWKKQKDNWTNSFTTEVDGNTLQISINDLMPLSSYNFRIYAVNSIGRSEQSQLVIVKTDEQVPISPPTSVKAEAITARSILVKWMSPKHLEKFGSITGYYIGYKVSNADNQQFTFNTIESESYVEDFSDKNHTISSNVTFVSSTNNTRSNLQYEYLITNLHKATTYTIIVQAYNSKGAGPASNENQCKTKEKDPPVTPQFTISNVSVRSATITWTSNLIKTSPNYNEDINGYQIFVRNNDWESNELIKNVINSSLPLEHTLNNLKCGSKYQIYLIAFNEAGNSEPSSVQTFQTSGNVPIMPDKQQLVVANSTTALIKLNSFKPALCPITSYEIKYKLQQDTEWVEINNLESTKFTPVFELIELRPASWYNLVVVAFSEAGFTQADYLFSTLTSLGSTIAPQSVSSAQHPNEEQKLRKYIQLMLPICSALVALVVIVIFLVFFNVKRNQAQASTNSICDTFSSIDHRLSQPNLLHLQHNQNQQQLHPQLQHYSSLAQTQQQQQQYQHQQQQHHPQQHQHQYSNKNDAMFNSILLNGTVSKKLIYEANLNNVNQATLNTNDTISNSIYCPSPYATTRVSYYFQDNPISNCFLMNNNNHSEMNNETCKKLLQSNNSTLNQNCYDMPMLKDSNRNLICNYDEKGLEENHTQGTNLIEINNDLFN